MAWLISRALMADFENSHCLPAQAEASSGASSSGGEPSAPSSETPTPQAYLSADKMKEFFRLSRSGMTFAPLTDDRGEALSTWCQEDSRAKTFLPQDEELGSTAKVPASGVKWRELFKRFDPTTSSWRTHRCLFDEVLPESSVILPRWGMMRGGVLSERLTLGLRTSEKGSGLWPTPNTQGYRSDGELRLLAKMVGDTEEFRAMSTRAAQSKREAVLRRLGNNANAVMTGGATDMQSTLPTVAVPTSNSGSVQGTAHTSQVRAVFPTPTCQDAKNNGSASQQIRRTKPLNVVVGGSLNPNWVEWLMGWPIGWTDLKQSETDKFQQWLHSHGGCSVKPNKP